MRELVAWTARTQIEWDWTLTSSAEEVPQGAAGW